MDPNEVALWQMIAIILIVAGGLGVCLNLLGAFFRALSSRDPDDHDPNLEL